MPTIHELVIEAFYQKLLESPVIDRATAESLRDVLKSETKPKPENFTALLKNKPTTPQT